jgi:hypothetical protein
VKQRKDNSLHRIAWDLQCSLADCSIPNDHSV